MDRTKEEQEEEKELIESMDKLSKPILTPLITTCTTTNILMANADDDASTESSDTFETWTLVSDKQKFIEPHVLVKDNDNNRIEILKNSEPDEDEFNENERKMAEQQHLQDSLKDVNNDDFSDGISIISESESVGRISPHPYLRGHLQDLNLQFSTTDNLDDEILYRLRQEIPLVLAKDEDEQQLRHRRRSSATEDPPKEEQALQTSFQTVPLILDIPPVVKRGLRAVFYIGVALAILAVIGKIVNPTWQPLVGVQQPSAFSAQLEEKLNDMELQNNLMRAEIDLLNKQVKYLGSLKDPQQHKGKYKEGKTFKVWSGNGDSLKPVIITKEDLKKPYKCPDGSYVEIANMCLEQRPQKNEPSLVHQFGHIVENMKEQSETYKTLEKVAEELQAFQDDPLEHLNKILQEDKTAAHQPSTNEFIKNKPIYQPSEDVKQRYHHNHNEYEKSKPNTESKYHHKYHKSQEGENSFGKDNNPKENDNPSKNHETYEKFQDNLKEGLEKLKENLFKFSDYSKETFKKFQGDTKNTLEKLRDNSKEAFEKLRNTSKEKFKKIRDDSKETFKKIRDNSKEQFEKLKDYTQFRGKSEHTQNSNEKSSKERSNRHKRQNDDNNSKDSGEWQEKYMQHRENQRKRNERKYQDNENWYIKRGGSRESKRSGEKQYR